MLAGTSGRNAIPTHGGFNFSEFNIQDHRPDKAKATFVEQDHTHKKYAGLNPLNPPKATSMQSPTYGVNKDSDWREQTLPSQQPAQVPGFATRLGSEATNVSLMEWKRKHGFGQNDPSLANMLEERSVAPSPYRTADWKFQSDPYIHSDIGVPSCVNQNMLDNPTFNKFPEDMKFMRRGKHDHTNMKEHHTPTFENDSNIATGTHHTHGAPPHPVTGGMMRSTKGPLERPLLLSDLPQPPQPVPIR